MDVLESKATESKPTEIKPIKQSNKILSEKNRLPVAYILEQHRIVELHAYFLAENDGFKADPLYYWLAAENEVEG